MPHAVDPRKFTVKRCPSNAARFESSFVDRQRSKEGFLGEASRLQVLTDLGGGKVGEGLRDLVSLSSSIQSSGAIPTSWNLSEDSGANRVLDTIGINPNQLQQVAGGNNLNLGAANAGYNRAKQVFGFVSQGDFTLDRARTVVNDFRGLSTLLGNVYTPKENEGISQCFATPYAEELTYSFAPKQKFMFVVDFEFNPGFEKIKDKFRKMAFVVKQAERPNITFDYEEVNMYNFKTKVLKKTEYQPVTIRFYDDGLNAGANFHDLYLRSISPLANLSPEEYDTVEDQGMNFAQGGNAQYYGRKASSASMGQLYSGQKTILKAVHLYHIFKYGKYLNKYTFVNPKILNLELDDLDMSSSEVGEISMQLGYDGLHQHTSVKLDPTSYQRITNITQGDMGNDKYALKYQFPGNGTASPTNDNVTVGAFREQELSTDFIPSAAAEVNINSVNNSTGTILDDITSGINNAISTVANGLPSLPTGSNDPFGPGGDFPPDDSDDT